MRSCGGWVVFGRLGSWLADLWFVSPDKWGEGSKDLHHFIQVCAEARVAHLTRATGRQESEHLLGLIVGQYRWLLSITAVRAQAMCLLARVGLITPAAREAAARRAVTMRMEEEMRRGRG